LMIKTTAALAEVTPGSVFLDASAHTSHDQSAESTAPKSSGGAPDRTTTEPEQRFSTAASQSACLNE